MSLDLIEVDLSNVRSARELHARLVRALRFPEFYGHNWDAFWDAITGLVEMPHTLRLHGWSSLEAAIPGEAQQLVRCLHDFNRQHPDSLCHIDLRP